MNTPKTKIVDPNELPEVVTYIDAKAQLDEFRAEYADVFEKYDVLVQGHNDALQNADKVVRAHGVSCGPFDLYQYATKYNAEAFYDAVGREKFLQMGGSIETIPKYTVDKKLFDANVAKHSIPKNVVDAVVVIEPRYKTPKPIT